MRRLGIAALVIVILLIACTTGNHMKIVPEYKGVDKELQPYLEDYILISKQFHLSFDKPVTMGFTDIKDGDIVGLCHYAAGFREVDIDLKYWNKSGSMKRQALVYHELTHCLCGRDHDFGPGLNYPDDNLKKIVLVVRNYVMKSTEEEGFMDDNCPLSIMYPYVLSEECMSSHYTYYLEEMFNRCDPW